MTAPIHLSDFEEYAAASLPRMVYDYYAGGAHDEITLRKNREAYQRLELHYRVLRDVADRNLETELLGQTLSMPVFIAPTAFHQLANEEGEVATARAVARAGTVMGLSTLSTRSIEDVGAAAQGRLWFQLYVYKDREATLELIARAEAAGAKALLLTVDAQVWGIRERDVRNQFQLPPGLRMVNLATSGKSEFPEAGGSGLAAYVNTMFDPSLSWSDLEWLCSSTKLPVLIKGVVRGDDAAIAMEHGAAGVVVSNHGGRQLDTSPAPITVLPAVVEGVAGRGIVLIDGGIRRGTDVVKAVALGADAVAIGRPVLWGLATGGEDGVVRVLEMIRTEVDLAMALCGARTVDEVTEDLVG
ncbi:MAG: alpha-hydroxy-acid oxidizing protein [Gemmatimonas sp.]|nr:alpha-hydroxy-acid oxidizing protein [Gemmatimonas sp.]